MRVLIAGGGVAGTVAALAAHRAGLDPVVYEAYEESAGLAHGVYLTVAVNGLDALRAVDADHVVLDSAFPTGRVQFFSGTGKRLGTFPLGPRLADGTVTQTLRRDALYHGLYALAHSRGIRIEHGKRLVDASVEQDGVVARFGDGTAVRGDVLVGADGVHSTVRRLIDPEAPAPRYTGLGNTGGFTRRAEGVDAAPGDYVMIWGRDCFFGYTVAPDGEIWWFANPPSRVELSRESLRELTSEQMRARLLRLLARDRTPGARIVAATADGIGLTNQYDLPAVPRWHNGSMVIIGDAAHAVSPASGQGASMAAEDAVVLAQCLRDRPTVPAALDAYERLRRDRVEQIVAWGSSMNNTKRQGLAGRVLRDIFLPLILKRAARPEELDKMAWMFEHHIDWDGSR